MSLGKCKRLIEVDLPIKEISEHSMHDKSIRKGHIQRFHVWWARRPLAACRAVVLGTLLPDPVDPNCPEEFKDQAWKLLRPFGTVHPEDNLALRKALLDFITEFSAWEQSTDKTMISVARGLVKAAHSDDTLLVVDPFAGGGSMPLEVSRVGAPSFAMEYNPVAYLLLRSILIDIPKYGLKLVDELKRWGRIIQDQANKKLARYYPMSGQNFPFVYLWARTIRCEGPNCGAEIPLIRSLKISERGKGAYLKLIVDKKAKKVSLGLETKPGKSSAQRGTTRRGSVTCPICGYTTKRSRIELQANQKGFGIMPLAIIEINPKGKRRFRLFEDQDFEAWKLAEKEIEKIRKSKMERYSAIPNEALPYLRSIFNVHVYGIRRWGDLYTSRQVLALYTYYKLVHDAYTEMVSEYKDPDFTRVLTTLLAIAVDNMNHYLTNVSTWLSDHMISIFIQGQSLPMKFDFAEANPLVEELVGGFEFALDLVLNVVKNLSSIKNLGTSTVLKGSVTKIPLPDNIASAVVTDPPYYDAIPYSNLSDFFYVWLKRSIGELYPNLFLTELTEKDDEIVQLAERNPMYKHKTKEWFQNMMEKALVECRRILKPEGIAVVLFAHKTTEGWEALLQATINAGWMIVASWPIETERGARMRAKGSAVLASSVHIVCRPRPLNAGVGDWRDVLSELQPRVHSWMQRLVKEGIVGADAIFACIGPALEIFSRYDNVETAGGKKVELRKYLEHVWSAVAREALNMIFEGADPTGFEEDSRLTALWLWTFRTGTNRMNEKAVKEKASGYNLEYDAARKIAQGIGAHLEELARPNGIIKMKGKVATLLLVGDRRKALWGKETEMMPRKKKVGQQLTLTLKPVVEEAVKGLPEKGRTVLDRLHQAMLLFADGRSEALKRFLIEEGIGRDSRFWRLAQALSALYPRNCPEKRWVDGVLARKKTMGF